MGKFNQVLISIVLFCAIMILLGIMAKIVFEPMPEIPQCKCEGVK